MAVNLVSGGMCGCLYRGCVHVDGDPSCGVRLCPAVKIPSSALVRVFAGQVSLLSDGWMDGWMDKYLKKILNGPLPGVRSLSASNSARLHTRSPSAARLRCVRSVRIRVTSVLMDALES